MEVPRQALAYFPAPVRTQACNRITPRSRSILIRIRDGEVFANRARDQRPGQTADPHRRERSSDCLPNELLLRSEERRVGKERSRIYQQEDGTRIGRAGGGARKLGE